MQRAALTALTERFVLNISKIFAVRSLTRFFAVGIGNTIVAFIAFPILYWISSGALNLNILLLISAVFCTLFSFISHRFVTFESRGRVHYEVLRFFVLQGAVYLLNVVLFNTLLHVTQIHPVILQALIVIGLLAVNYIALNSYIFPKSLPAAGDQLDEHESSSQRTADTNRS